MATDKAIVKVAKTAARRVKEKAKRTRAVARTTVANRKESATSFATLVNVHEETVALTAIP